MNFDTAGANTDPQTQPVATITGLYIYPIKSCRGIEMQASQVNITGLEHDREFMLVETGSGEALTQRELPRMALIAPRLVEDGLVVEAPGMEKLELRLEVDGPQREVKLWDDTCRAVSQGATAQRWFSKYLGVNCELTRLAGDFERKVTPDYARRPTDQVSFADGFPCLLVSAESLADLNRRMEIALPMNRFRPNIVIAGSGIPFFEDGLDRVQMGEIVFDVVKPCARCAITTTDQATAQVNKEPLKTLATFRRGQSGGVMFGQNIIPHSGGRLKVGDSLMVLQTKESPLLTGLKLDYQ